MLLVTFDSNVWRPASDPSRFSGDQEHSSFVKVHAALKGSRLDGRLSETVFTLEALKRSDRRNFLALYSPKAKGSEEELADGTIQSSISAVPDSSAHPGNNPYLTSHLNDALAVGFKLMHCPRVTGVQNSDLRPEWFVQSQSSGAHDTASKFGEVSRRIEAAGAGIAHIKGIGNRYADATEAWFQGIAKAPTSEDKTIATAVAEWADGDSVAAHVAYANHLFCTRDIASAAGQGSVLSPQNRAWLTHAFGVEFVSISELADRI